MGRLAGMTPDYARLYELCFAQPTILPVLRAVERRRLHGRITRPRAIIAHIDPPQGGAARWEMVMEVFAALMQAGFGVLSYPTNRRKCGFRWVQPPRELLSRIFQMVVMRQLPDGAGPVAPDPATVVPTLSVPRKWRRVELELRPGMTVLLAVPRDLSRQEAERLSHLVLSLPME